MKKIIVPLFVVCAAIMIGGWVKGISISEDVLEKVIIQEFKGENAIFINKKEMNEIVKLLRGEFMVGADEQNISVAPDIFIIEKYKNNGTLTFGLSKNSSYIKCDIEGDIYWYKVTPEKRDEIYDKVKEKLQIYIETNKQREEF